ncbi:MAG: cytochrome-c oxidase, cbb3-type subunit III [Burkholderiaceae bacterium]|jgi:cytochrome c oxidase cbb3-type subunit 3
MSDAVSPFWDYYVAIIAVASILGCAVLLLSQNRVPTKKSNDPTPVESTGHVWDGDLAELNNPLPRWWMWLFYITIVFGLVYLVLYPATSIYGGLLGWTSHGALAKETAAAEAQVAPIYAKYRALDIPTLAGDPQAHLIGERLFMNNCSQCHGSDARGSKGFPNLTDQDWLYGGSPAIIEQTILHGRHGLMPSMSAAVGSPDDVRNVANYVRSLSGSPHDGVRAALGKPKFEVCAACHGADGKGNQALGAPDLSDQVWLFGGDVETIMQTVNNGRESVMPAHEEILGPDRVHLLAAYVWSLSNTPGAK